MSEIQSTKYADFQTQKKNNRNTKYNVFKPVRTRHWGKNFVSDGHLCDRFCLAQPKIENL